MFLSEFDSLTLAVIAVAFIFGGLSKGFIGFGLPLVSIPVCATVVSVPLAIALTAAPILVSNLYQTFHGGRQGIVARRFWPYLVTLIAGVLIGAQILARADHETILVIVGSLLLIFVTAQFFDIKPDIPSKAERRLNPIIGFIAGLLGGVSSMFGPIAITYLVALKLPKDLFISTIGLFYLTGIVPLYVTLVVTGVISRDEIIASVLVCIPLYVGLWFGTWLRGRMSQELFQRALLIALVIISLNMIRGGLF